MEVSVVQVDRERFGLWLEATFQVLNYMFKEGELLCARNY